MRRIVVAALAAFAVAVTPAAAQPSPRCADAVAGTAPAPCLRDAVVWLVNQQRVANGLVPLKQNYRLHLAAQSWTDAMVASDYLGHGTVGQFIGRIEGAGYRWWSVIGENAGTGFATPRQIVDAWMSSPEHRANILDPRYRDVGTGMNASSVPGYAPGGTWVQDFGVKLPWAPGGHHG